MLGELSAASVRTGVWLRWSCTPASSRASRWPERFGVTLEDARVFVTRPPGTEASETTRTQMLAHGHFDRLTTLLPQLSNAAPGSDEARQLVDEALGQLMMLRELLR